MKYPKNKQNVMDAIKNLVSQRRRLLAELEESKCLQKKIKIMQDKYDADSSH